MFSGFTTRWQAIPRATSTSSLPRFAVSFGRLLQDGVIIRKPAEMAQPPKGQSGSHRALEMWERKLIETTYGEARLWSGRHGDAVCRASPGEVLYLDVDRDVDFQKKNAHRARRGILL